MKKDIHGRLFHSDEEVQEWVRLWIHQRPTSFYKTEIDRLVSQWDKCISERARYYCIMFEKAQYKKPIFQGLITRVQLDIETRDQVFCVALGPVTICITIGTIGLLYVFYSTG